MVNWFTETYRPRIPPPITTQSYPKSNPRMADTRVMPKINCRLKFDLFTSSIFDFTNIQTLNCHEMNDFMNLWIILSFS